MSYNLPFLCCLGVRIHKLCAPMRWDVTPLWPYLLSAWSPDIKPVNLLLFPKYCVHTMFHLPERTPELGLLHLFSWRVNGKCVFQELGLPRLLCTTKLVGFAPGAVAAPAIFLASERKAGAAPAIYVNIRWIRARFCRARFFSPSPTHAVFCIQPSFALRAQMNVVGTLDWACNFHPCTCS